MPRDGQGVYTPPRNWQTDAANGTPFDPAKWQQQDADFAAALNDLPLRSVVPTWVGAGTSPATVNPGSLMRQDNVIYVRPDEAVWIDISSIGLTDASAIVTEALSQIRAGVAANLDTLPEIVAKIEEQLTSIEASSLYAAIAHSHAFAGLTAKPTTLAGYGISDAAAAGHSHAFADVTGLQAALDGKSATGHSHTVANISNFPAYTEDATAPATPAVRDEWRDTVSGALYKRVSNGGAPIWQQIG